MIYFKNWLVIKFIDLNKRFVGYIVYLYNNLCILFENLKYEFCLKFLF